MIGGSDDFFRARGISLIEVMIALLVGVVILGGVMQLLIGSKETYQTSDAVARLQENGRFAIETLARDIRLAGHMGCADPEGRDAVDMIGLGIVYPTFAAVVGVDGQTDAITVRYGAAAYSELASGMASTSDALNLVKKPTNLAAGDAAILSSCGLATLINIEDIDDKTVTHTGTDQIFEAGARLMRLATNTYEIRQVPDRKTKAGDPIYSLYRNGRELVEGVENLQIRYGQGTGGSVRYVDWSSGLAFEELVTVQVALLLQSIDEVAEVDDNATYNLAGVEVGPAADGAVGPTHAVDRRIRRVFSATVNLRNSRTD